MTCTFIYIYIYVGLSEFIPATPGAVEAHAVAHPAVQPAWPPPLQFAIGVAQHGAGRSGTAPPMEGAVGKGFLV